MAVAVPADFLLYALPLSDRAFRLFVEGLGWSAQQAPSGCLPGKWVRRQARCPSAVDELLAGGWWVEDGDAYVIRSCGWFRAAPSVEEGATPRPTPALA